MSEKVFVNKEVGHVRGSVVESWSEDGAPHWQPQMHWLDVKDRKLRCLVPTEAGLQLGSEDNEIEPERAKFIRTAVKDWELWRELRY